MYDIEFIKKAYIKLKSHLYYDSSELFQRRQLAIFETDMDNNDILGVLFETNNTGLYNKKVNIKDFKFDFKFEKITEELNNYNHNNLFFTELFNNLDIIALPKKFTHQECSPNFITNKRISNSYEIERVTYFIDIPIELQLISILWTMKYGFQIDKNLGDECLGNRLILNHNKTSIAEGSSLFKPYFKQYQKWRDDAVSEAKKRLTNNESIAFLNLDIKNYFHSVRFDFNKIENELSIDSNDNLHIIFKRIHQEYTRKLISENILDISIENDNKVILPIGLLSSYVLANYYLKDFDKRIIQKIRPLYYGRYVDDVLIIVSKPDFDYNKNESSEEIKFDFDYYKNKELKNKENINFDYDHLTEIEKYILETFYPIIKIINPLDSEERVIKLTSIPECYIQSDKTLLYYFDSNESIAVIDKLKQDLNEKTSEFRDLPENNEIDDSFDKNAYHLLFDGSEGKIKTLKDYKENRYGLSVFLANRIFSKLKKNKNVDEIESDKILKLFRGVNTLEYYKLWEKIFTYFLVNEDRKGFLDFYHHTYEQIKKIKFKNVDTQKKIKKCLLKHFDISVELTFSLNPSFFKKGTKEYQQMLFLQNSIKNEYNNLLGDEIIEPESFVNKRFRISNMIRHHYVFHPLLNYASSLKSNLIDRNINVKIKWRETSLNNSPRKVKFWECCIAIANKRIQEASLKEDGARQDEKYFYTNILNEKIKTDDIDDNISVDDSFFLEEAYQLYEKINLNHLPIPLFQYQDRKKLFYDLKQNKINKIQINELLINNRDIIKKPKISFANIKLNENYFLESLRGKPNLDDRYNTLSKVLNESRKEDADLLLLPECSVPYSLVSMLARYSEVNQTLVIAGLEHWNINKISHNFIVTILPFEVNGIKDSVVIYRLKNHYSHHEESLVRGNHYIVPRPLQYRYDLFNWRGLHFAPYYCVELADIYHRSIFRSKVDLIIASEWNPDTNYFSNIVESLSRDLHSYVAQVNNSHYGDSRLTQPSKTESKDLLKLKGGLNDTILVGQIDINLLREYQRKSYDLTNSDKNFKPIPPDFDLLGVMNRINNKKHYEDEE